MKVELQDVLGIIENKIDYHQAVGGYEAVNALENVKSEIVASATPHAPEPTRGFVQRNGNAGWNWYHKDTSEECIRCGRWFEKGHCNDQDLCYSCQNEIAEDADTAAGGGS